jgi:hypothetical protein
MSNKIIIVEPMNSSHKNSKIINSVADVPTVIIDKDVKCYWNNTPFDDGSKIRDNDVTYRCHMGYWLKLDPEG